MTAWVGGGVKSEIKRSRAEGYKNNECIETGVSRVSGPGLQSVR